MERPRQIDKGVWVLRAKALDNDDQGLQAYSLGRVSGPEGVLTMVSWQDVPIPPRVPVYLDTLESLNGCSRVFDAALDKIVRIGRVLERVAAGDPPQLHRKAVNNLSEAAVRLLQTHCPDAAKQLESTRGEFNSLCVTPKSEARASACKGCYLAAIKALPWEPVR